MKYSFQIFTGSLSYQKADYKKIKENLKYVIKLPGKNIGKIIIGWNTDLNLYHDLASYLNNYKLDLYLWFPVFSELGSDVSIEKVLDWQGRKSKSISFNKGENFDFYCPNNPVNIEKIKTTFNKYFDDKMFKGVFLDKIRFPSFSNSKNAVYTCFCTECQNKMEQNGIDVEYLKNVIERQKSISKENIFSINQYSDLEYNFTNKIWQEFFHYKQTSIAEALKKLSCFFRDKGLTVGLDVFAPFLGYFVGQNIKMLAESADYIKPMLYRQTDTPAGLIHEVKKLISCVSSSNFTGEKQMKKRIVDIYNINDYEELFSVDFMRKEIESIQKNIMHEIDIIPGIEANREENIVNIKPSYLQESISNIKKVNGIEEVLISWDLVNIPEENIKALIDLI